jgi:hypothetical protein
MENEDSDVKQTALDNKSAYAGNLSPDPEMDTDQVGEQAGLDIQPAKPLSIAENFIKRDQRRYELEVDSALTDSASDLLSESSSDDLSGDFASDSDFTSDSDEVDELEIVQTETGQYEGIETQEIPSAAFDEPADFDDFTDEQTDALPDERDNPSV